MSKVKVRIISCVLAVIMLLSLATSAAFAEDDSNETTIEENSATETAVETIPEDEPFVLTENIILASEDATEDAQPEENSTQAAAVTTQQLVPNFAAQETLADVYRPGVDYDSPADPYTFNSLAAIAMEEVEAEDNAELPAKSDNVKYNSWFYGHSVGNTFNAGTYEQTYGWNAVFVAWCAEKMGLLELERFPKTVNGSELYAWFAENTKTQLYTKSDLTAEINPFIPSSDDLIFFPANGTFISGIIIEEKEGILSYVMGDVDCKVRLIKSPITDLPDDVRVIRWKADYDFLIPYVNYMVDEIGLTRIGAIGVLANMYCESRFNPRCVGDGGTSYGLCQWHNGRWISMMDVCDAAGEDWTTTAGQLFFLKDDFNTYYQELREMLNALPNNVTGAEDAAMMFCLVFERPAGMEESGKYRSYVAANILYPALTGR